MIEQPVDLLTEEFSGSSFSIGMDRKMLVDHECIFKKCCKKYKKKGKKHCKSCPKR